MQVLVIVMQDEIVDIHIDSAVVFSESEIAGAIGLAELINVPGLGIHQADQILCFQSL